MEYVRKYGRGGSGGGAEREVFVDGSVRVKESMDSASERSTSSAESGESGAEYATGTGTGKSKRGLAMGWGRIREVGSYVTG